MDPDQTKTPAQLAAVAAQQDAQRTLDAAWDANQKALAAVVKADNDAVAAAAVASVK